MTIPDKEVVLNAALGPGLAEVVQRVNSCLRIGSILKTARMTRTSTLGLPDKGPGPGLFQNKCVIPSQTPRFYPRKRAKVAKSVPLVVKVTKRRESAVLQALSRIAKRLFLELVLGPGPDSYSWFRGWNHRCPRVTKLRKVVIPSHLQAGDAQSRQSQQK